MIVLQTLVLIVTVQIGARQPQVTYMYLYKEYYQEKVWAIAVGKIVESKIISVDVFEAEKAASNGRKHYPTYNIMGECFSTDKATIKFYQNWEDLVVDHFDKVLNCTWVKCKVEDD